jgi:hypothetical protein
MAVIQTGSNTAGLQNVDASYAARVSTNQVNQRLGGETPTPNFVGAVRSFYEKDPGSLTGTPYLSSPNVSEDDMLQVGLSTPIFDYVFNATVQDTSMWYCAFTTMTITESGGSILFNANSTNTAATGCYIQSKRYFNLTGNAGAHVEFISQITSAPVAGEVFLSGLGIPVSAAVAPTDGVWFQFTSAGLVGVLSYAGATTTTGTLPIGGSALTITPNTNGDFKIIVDDRVIEFWINGIFLGEILTPAGNATPFMSDSLPLFQQYYNSGTVTGTAMQVKVGAIHIDQLDSNLGKSYSDIQASKGLIVSQGVNGGTMGSTALLSNNLAVGTGTAMTNTTAALGVGLGGQFTALPTLAVGTDGIVCSYLNPIGGINQTPRTLYITGMWISSIVSIVLTGGPVLYEYSLAYGHTALSMATAETGSFVTASAKAPRRLPLGWDSFVATAAVGSTGLNPGALERQFRTAIPVNPGEYIAVCAKNIGTVTTAGAITILVGFDGYME